ncbi:MAG: hypothetical protein IKN10_08055 [Muribaculaceae bacterium]|jgi:hypothetical protein|nr:hypothetical protein [Muribaculaceae bacterium]
MNKLRLLFILLVALLCPVIGQAQDDDAIDFEAVVAPLSAQCPHDGGGGWLVTSVVVAEDTIVVDLETPASISGFLSALTGNNPNVKRLWLKHLLGFGEEWKHLAELMTEEGRSLLLRIKPQRDEEFSCVLISGREIGTILANL